MSLPSESSYLDEDTFKGFWEVDSIHKDILTDLSGKNGHVFSRARLNEHIRLKTQLC